MTSEVVRPSFAEFAELARDFTVVPVWRGAGRSRDAVVGVREAGRRPRGLPARIGRARRALGSVLVPRARSRAHVRRARPQPRMDRRHPARGRSVRPGNAGRARRAAREIPRPNRPSSHRSTAASSAGSATTPCARSSACPSVPADDLGFPDAVCSLAGQVAAFDHFRQRCYLIENVYPPPGCDDAALRALRRRGREAGGRGRRSRANRCRTRPRSRRPTS